MTTNKPTNNPITTITEGSAVIFNEGQVFYNPVQQFNRDLSVAVLSTFIKTASESFKEKGIVILEALSASGLRSIRYAKEVPGLTKIIANDLSKEAVNSIIKNTKHNNVEDLVEPSCADAITLMYTSTKPEKRFSIIDLDPYGCPTRFLDGAVQSLADGGLLLVTATDMAVLCGNTPEACFVKYGTVPVKMSACHEMALRILLRCIESHANKYGRHIKPLLCISADFYIRVFVQIFTSPLACKLSCSKQSMLYQCNGCETFSLQPLGTVKPNPSKTNPNQVKFGVAPGPVVGINCEHCYHKHKIAGPIWSDPIHNEEFVTNLLDTLNEENYKTLVTRPRITGMLNVVKEELPDVCLYYSIAKMCSILKLEVIPVLKIRSALLENNYRVSFSHACKISIKTDAPTSVLWDILRCWAKEHPVNKKRFIESTPLKAILSVEPKKIYTFEKIHPDANPMSRKYALVRFPENPAAHWGPGTRATLMVGSDKMLKSTRNQNKTKSQMKRDLNEADIQSEESDAKHTKLS